MAQEKGRHESGRKASEGGRGIATKASPAAIEHYLKGLEYPASKDDLIAQARDNGAPEDVLFILDQMDDRDYDSPIDISREVGKIE